MSVVKFKEYFTFTEEIKSIQGKNSIESFKGLILIFLKIVSYITIICPIFCAIGVCIQKRSGNSEEDKKVSRIRDEVLLSPNNSNPTLSTNKPLVTYEKETTAGFIFYHRLPNNRDYVCKMHISLDRNSDQFETANLTIQEILEKRGVQNFKFVNLDADEEIKGDENLNGKEVTVYFNSEELKLSFDLILEINKKLKDLKIESGTPSIGDVLLPNNTYCYSRNSKNIFNHYINALYLKNAGFTNIESAIISTGGLINSKTSVWEVIDQYATSENTKNYNMQIDFIKQFKADCYANVKGSFLPGALGLIIGQSSVNANNPSTSSFISLVFPSVAKNNNKGASNALTSEDNLKDSLFETEEFIEIFNTAANYLIDKFTKANNLKPDKLGCILPAIYYSVFVPLNEILRDIEPKSKIEITREFLKREKGRIVDYIITCSLRSRE